MLLLLWLSSPLRMMRPTGIYPRHLGCPSVLLIGLAYPLGLLRP